MTTIFCPVCNGASPKVMERRRQQVIDEVQHALGAEGLNEVPFPDVALHCCASCGLGFASPMQEPGEEFYRWAIRAGLRYPDSRWEWAACLDFLASEKPAHSRESSTIVDVGCGDGKFLGMAQAAGYRCVGLDLNPDVVAHCRAMGLEVLQGDLAAAKANLPGGVDAVCLWHVVEHVGDPVGVIRQARELLRPGGWICFSVPLSPMSYEHSWPDPFNYPPHHLTRWGLPALEALAKRLGVSVKFTLPGASSYATRVARSLILQAMPAFGVHGRVRKTVRLTGFLLRRPWALVREAWVQARLPRVGGRVRPDVVLVSLQC